MTTKLDALAASVQAAVQTMVDCKTIPSESVSAIWGDTDHKELEPMLLGSLLKFGPVGQASEFYAAVSTTGEVVFGTGDRAKLALSKSGGTGPLSKMTGPELKAAGLTHCILGIFSNTAGAGSNAGSVTVGGLAATLAPVCAAEFEYLAITIGGGQPQHQAIEAAVLTTGLHWRVWSGQIGGAGATPEGGGLRPIAEADAVEVNEASLQGTGTGAALVGAAVRTMGVTDALSGKCTTETLADFIAAWAGITQASPIVSVCLAEDRDDTTTRAAAKAAGEAIKDSRRRRGRHSLRPSRRPPRSRRRGRRSPTPASSCWRRTSARSPASHAWRPPPKALLPAGACKRPAR